MRFSALLAVPIALVGLAVPASAEDPGLTVTWPTTTNVDTWDAANPYILTVADTAAEPQGTLYAEWLGGRQEIPHTGDHAMRLVKSGVGTIKVIRCVPADPEPVCTDTGVASPSISVYDYLSHVLRNDAEKIHRPGDQAVSIWEGSVPGATLNVAWSMRLIEGSADIASGTKTVILDDAGAAEFALPIPATASSGAYNVSMDVTTETSGGLYRARDFVQIRVDGTAPSGSATLSGTALYPYRDGYRDTISLSGSGTEYADTRVDVVNSSGKVVRTFNEGYTAAPYVKFDGRTVGGAILGAGRYSMRVTRTDEVGNKGIVSRAFSLSHKRLQKKTWTRTFKAGATLTRNGAFVQACSTLRKPALRPWAGSLGYYSRTKCNRNNADIVSTTNGVYVPKAFQSKYHTYQVSFYGGRARSVRNAYIVMGYLNNKDDFSHRIQGGSAVRSYAGKVASAGTFVRDKTTRPYVLWTAGLTDGSRYDVKSFTVKLTYTVLA